MGGTSPGVPPRRPYHDYSGPSDYLYHPVQRLFSFTREVVNALPCPTLPEDKNVVSVCTTQRFEARNFHINENFEFYYFP